MASLPGALFAEPFEHRTSAILFLQVGIAHTVPGTIEVKLNKWPNIGIRWLPDGVRTEGVIAEVPRIPYMLPHVGAHFPTRADYGGIAALLRRTPSVPTPSGSRQRRVVMGNSHGKYANMWQHVWDLRHICDDPVRPDPVWKLLRKGLLSELPSKGSKEIRQGDRRVDTERVASASGL